MVRRTKGATFQDADAGRQDTGDAMDLGSLERLAKSETWKHTGKAFGEHRLARARRADHEHIVAASGGYLQGALSHGLATHFFEIG